MSKKFFILFFSYLFSTNPVPNTGDGELHPAFPYNLNQPNAIFEMPESLKEISGLSPLPDNKTLAAVNDEEGIVFLINQLNGEVIREIRFWGEGDYEGLEISGDDAYIIKSSGTIYQVKNFMSDNPKTHKINSFLNKENDVEGLACIPGKNCLLVGCKGKVIEGEGNQAPFKKAIYEFDLVSMVMKNEPVFMLTLPDIREHISHMLEHGEMEKLLEDFSEDEDELKFSPSGIAIHPFTNDIYVTSSKGKSLLVLDQQGKILHLKKLQKEIHRQPEGICFDADGTLYIANEGKKDKALLYKFLSIN